MRREDAADAAGGCGGCGGRMRRMRRMRRGDAAHLAGAMLALFCGAAAKIM